METNTDKRKTLIRRLLVEQLLPEEKQNLLKRNSVENEMKKQWKQFEDDPIKSEVKKRIWRNVQRRCEGKSDTLVHNRTMALTGCCCRNPLSNRRFTVFIRKR